jgi:asparagine synthase (glutamine-hydrolysing)
MCGIAGILALDDRQAPVAPTLLAAMSDAIAHRGPDGAGTWIAPDGRIGFAHRRLAIIDPAPAAAQPMSDADGRLWITYNGEIYNHAEVRAELERAGRTRWRTDHSDTEVILQAFAHWGIEGLARLRGMFAFALWDAERRELWLVRDRIGIKPLYYAFAGDRLLFGSEIKAILADSTVERRVDEGALFHFLSFLTAPAPHTLFAGVRKLPCATWLRVTADGRVTERRYWDLWDHVRPGGDAREQAVAARLIDGLEDAVQLHKVADVPVGVFLSGGIDSSTNAVLFSRRETRPVRTFSIGYQGDYPSYPSELEYARAIAQRIGAEHHELLLSEEHLLSFLPEMIWLQDEPIADPVCIPVHYVSRLAREHGVKVCQVGEGADELFAGYPSWRTTAALERLAGLPLTGPAKRAGAAALARRGGTRGFRYEWLRRSAAGLPIFWGGAEAFTEGEKRELLAPRLRAEFARRSSWEVIEPFWERFQRSAPDPHPLNWMAYIDLNLRLPELLLMRVDKMSMGVALEARVPYLDHRFVELAMGIDPRLKVRHRTLKYILKRAVRDLIPPGHLRRPKQGFGLPLREWFSGALGRHARDTLERFCRHTDLLDPAAVRRVLDEGRPNQTWYLLNFALWWERYVGR